MLRKLTLLLSGVVLALAVPAAAQAGKTFYWISHGSPADPVWTYFLAGAKQWATDTGNTVATASGGNGIGAPMIRRPCRPLFAVQSASATFQFG